VNASSATVLETLVHFYNIFKYKKGKTLD
jgi:hypothetical protein